VSSRGRPRLRFIVSSTLSQVIFRPRNSKTMTTSADSPTIAEIKEMRDSLEGQLLEMLAEFESRTGVSVDEIAFQRVATVSGSQLLSVDVKLAI
jgi:hypothetical protein